MNILHNLQNIRIKVSKAEHSAQIPPGTVQLLAVSKGQPDSNILQALQAGQHHFGENYVQEALIKIKTLENLPLTWHFIGPIQSNKCKAISEHFSWVHSVYRADIAQKLHDARPPHLSPLNICIQVNLTGETSKSGLNIQDLDTLVHIIKGLSRLKLRGLMFIPPLLTEATEQYALFSEFQTYMEKIKQSEPTLDTLSMGMSNDFIPAIHAGSTLIRIGRGIFGERR